MVSPYEFEEVIRFSDCDPAGICYFGKFSTFFDESFISLSRDEGIGWDEHETYNFLIPIVETKTEFFSPLKAGETAHVYCAITHIGSRSFTTSHVITNKRGNAEQIVAKGYISRVTVDYHSFQAYPIPEPLKTILNKYQISEADWDIFVANYKN